MFIQEFETTCLELKTENNMHRDSKRK